MIHLHQVSCARPEGGSLFEVNLFLPKASYTRIKGSDHAAKSTLLNLILAVEQADSGSLNVAGIDLTSIPDARLPYLRRQLGIVSVQQPLFDDHTVLENLRMPLTFCGLQAYAIDERLTHIIDLARLKGHENRRVNKLDLPTRRIVEVARAIVHNPAILFAESPCTDMSQAQADHINNMLFSSRDHGATVIVTSESDLPADVPGNIRMDTYYLNHGRLSKHPAHP